MIVNETFMAAEHLYKPHSVFVWLFIWAPTGSPGTRGARAGSGRKKKVLDLSNCQRIDDFITAMVGRKTKRKTVEDDQEEGLKVVKIMRGPPGTWCWGILLCFYIFLDNCFQNVVIFLARLATWCGMLYFLLFWIFFFVWTWNLLFVIG